METSVCWVCQLPLTGRTAEVTASARTPVPNGCGVRTEEDGKVVLCVHEACEPRVVTMLAAAACGNDPWALSFDHKWRIRTFKSPTYCDHCTNFIYGIMRQGMRCTYCGQTIHKHCLSDLENPESGVVACKVPLCCRGDASRGEGGENEEEEDRLAMRLVNGGGIGGGLMEGTSAQGEEEIRGEATGSDGAKLSMGQVARLAGLVNRARHKLLQAILDKVVVDVESSPTAQSMVHWLEELGLGEYHEAFLAMFDSLADLVHNVTEQDLSDLSIFNPEHRVLLLQSASEAAASGAYPLEEEEGDGDGKGVGADSEPRLTGEELAKYEQRRLRICDEIRTTESTYVRSLELLESWFLVPLRDAIGKTSDIAGMMKVLGMSEEASEAAASDAQAAPGTPTATVSAKKSPRVPLISPEDYVSLFGNLAQITDFHRGLSSHLERRLEAFDPHTTSIGDLFASKTHFFRSYAYFVNAFDDASATLQRLLKKHKAFRRYVEAFEAQAGLSLGGFLIMPVQRIPRYILLVSDLIKHTRSDHPDFGSLERALYRVKEVANFVNRSAAQYAALKEVQSRIKGSKRPMLVQHHRRLIREAPMTRVFRSGSKQRKIHVFLFNDLWVETTPAGKNKFKFVAAYRLTGATARTTDEGWLLVDVWSQISDLLYAVDEPDTWAAEITSATAEAAALDDEGSSASASRAAPTQTAVPVRRMRRRKPSRQQRGQGQQQAGEQQDTEQACTPGSLSSSSTYESYSSSSSSSSSASSSSSSSAATGASTPTSSAADARSHSAESVAVVAVARTHLPPLLRAVRDTDREAVLMHVRPVIENVFVLIRGEAPFVAPHQEPLREASKAFLLLCKKLETQEAQVAAALWEEIKDSAMRLLSLVKALVVDLRQQAASRDAPH